MTGSAESLELADACVLAQETRKEEAESDVVEDCVVTRPVRWKVTEEEAELL